jgi:uncharacterized protein DUF3551
MRIVTMAGLLAAAVLVDAGARNAEAAAWCAWYDAYTYNCGYYTFEQCLATIRGAGGYCARNVHDYYARPPDPRRHRRHGYYD